MRSLKEQADDLEISLPQDIDPEDDPFAKRGDNSDSDEAPSEAGISGREHYEEVSKSKLRKLEQPVLGKQYTGASVSRKTLFDDDGNEKEEDTDDEDGGSMADSSSELSTSASAAKNLESEEDNLADFNGLDPENTQIDQRLEDNSSSEIDSDEAFGSGDEERFRNKGFTFRGTKKDLVPLETEAAAAAAAAEEEDGDSNEDGALVWDTDDEVEVDESDELGTDQDDDTEMEDENSQIWPEGKEGSNTSSDSDSTTSQEPSAKPSTDRQKQARLAHDNVSDANTDSDSNTSPLPARKPTTNREKLRALVANEAAAVASTLSASANADVQKGKAVKQQYATFDRLLDVRIKLQRGLTAADTLVLPSNPSSDIESAAHSAEEAALKLFSTIESLRHDIADASLAASSSKKRKRPAPPTSATLTDALWTRISTLEESCLPHRHAILNKWSTRTRAAPAAPRSQLDRTMQAEDNNTMTRNLAAQLTFENADDSRAESDFYQSLLRDLISSRAALSESQHLLSDVPLPSAAPKRHRAGVDTKASKGRKVRYTVHEKLQNFTAEEERGTWTEAARREFFASLFGAVGRLNEEDVDVDGDDAGADDVAMGEEAALRLFRS